MGLAEYLCNMPRHGATHGIIQGEAEFRKASASRRFQDWSALFILDRLVSLAEIVGVLRMENPEQGRWGENLYEAPDELVAKLESALGIGITVPAVEGCLFTLETKSGRLHFRDITALYAAWRIRAITNHLEGAAICEIGGGVGRVAYYCSKFGIGNFAIFDLPLVNVLQGYFLIRALPGANVVLYGEDMPADGRAIRVLPGWAFQEVPSKTFDLVLNQDSFPEIERSTVREYLREIGRTTRSALPEHQPRGRVADRRVDGKDAGGRRRRPGGWRLREALPFPLLGQGRLRGRAVSVFSVMLLLP